MIIDPQSVALRIQEIAEVQISPRFGRLGSADIDTKTSPTDLVTIVDREAEAELERALGDLYPGAGFIGEESVAADPSLLDGLKSDGAYWIVDPLDGTRNFVRGHREFGTIVALVVDQEIRMGWLYGIPDSLMCVASAGDGVTINGEKLPAALRRDKLIGCRAVGGLAQIHQNELVPKLRSGFETDTLHCSAYAYLKMLGGEKDFALFGQCAPWDHAAGVLSVREAGGVARYLDNDEAYRPIDTKGRPLLSAPTMDAFDAVAKHLTT